MVPKPVLFLAPTSAPTIGQEDPWPFSWRPGPSCGNTAPRCPPVPNLKAPHTQLPLQHNCFHNFLIKRHYSGGKMRKLEKLTLASEIRYYRGLLKRLNVS